MQETVVVSCQLHLANKSVQVGAWRGTWWRVHVFERNCKEHKTLRCMHYLLGKFLAKSQLN